ncbi:carbohydrate-binding module family 13 protein [Coniophora puteana RWD-64-598 SS2]|uniref:Carbohydrate-binding module family 13 protein n=1 Tax=Coniophora puteana (strain RWD-64-598) TaxID=741705 RepID=A0A5M3MK34_CONPW|nr:carbohydrate-binding module family 13 protein [Coniophora puteana RWD-64-598 SS2]EIW78961.1 carbohydrate-binding module family 13 protein [Coniophora puteana RWD-64-598 SS2]
MSIIDHSQSEATVIEEFERGVHSPLAASSSDARGPSMETTPIRPGVYLLLQSGGQIAMDLVNENPVEGHLKHEYSNQKWEISPFEAGYSIRSLYGILGKYLTCETDSSVITKTHPVSWAIQDIPGNREPTIRIVWPNSPLAITLSSFDPGTKVRMFDGLAVYVNVTKVKLAPIGEPGQEWTVRRVGEPTTNPAPGAPVISQATYTVSSSEPAIRVEGAGNHPTIVINDGASIPENGELVFTSTTTTTTVTKVERNLRQR